MGVKVFNAANMWPFLRKVDRNLKPAIVIDLFSLRIVGWAMAARMTVELAQKALAMAFEQRNLVSEVFHYSGRGSRYTAIGYQQLLNDRQCQISMSGTGNCYDNAPTESFFGRLKMEWVHPYPLPNLG